MNQLPKFMKNAEIDRSYYEQPDPYVNGKRQNARLN